MAPALYRTVHSSLHIQVHGARTHESLCELLTSPRLSTSRLYTESTHSSSQSRVSCQRLRSGVSKFVLTQCFYRHCLEPQKVKLNDCIYTNNINKERLYIFIFRRMYQRHRFRIRGWEAFVRKGMFLGPSLWNAVQPQPLHRFKSCKLVYCYIFIFLPPTSLGSLLNQLVSSLSYPLLLMLIKPILSVNTYRPSNFAL